MDLSEEPTFAACTTNFYTHPQTDGYGPGWGPMDQKEEDRYIESMEFNRLLGIEHMYNYVLEQIADRNAVYSLFPALSRALKYYEKIGFNSFHLAK